MCTEYLSSALLLYVTEHLHKTFIDVRTCTYLCPSYKVKLDDITKARFHRTFFGPIEKVKATEIGLGVRVIQTKRNVDSAQLQSLCWRKLMKIPQLISPK